MNTIDVTMVRVYLVEGRGDISHVIKWLQEDNVRGFTVFRGVEGQGSHGVLHKASLLDLSSELPIVIEFFDVPERVEQILEQLQGLIEADHIVSWSAKTGK